MSKTLSNIASSVVNFPIQRQEVDEYTGIAEYILDARLVITEGLNKVATGEVILTDKQKEDWQQRINVSNEVFIKYGFAPIYVNF